MQRSPAADQVSDPAFDWREDNSVWTASPDSRSVYACHKVSPRSTKFFARHNGTSLATRQTRIFYGSLEKCKALCELHFKNKYGVDR
jgi:hypothetical protein